MLVLSLNDIQFLFLCSEIYHSKYQEIYTLNTEITRLFTLQENDFQCITFIVLQIMFKVKPDLNFQHIIYLREFFKKENAQLSCKLSLSHFPVLFDKILWACSLSDNSLHFKIKSQSDNRLGLFILNNLNLFHFFCLIYRDNKQNFHL